MTLAANDGSAASPLPSLSDIARRREELLAGRSGESSSTRDEYGKILWPVLSRSALHGLAGDVIDLIEPHSEADPAAILMQFLAAFGNIIGPGPHCVVESTSHSLNLFVVLVGESSKARKGTSWGHIRRLFADVDPEWAAQRIIGALSGAEGLINEVRDEEIVTDRRLFAVSEFASVLRAMGREGSALSSILRDAWDNGNLRTLVKRDRLIATGAHISLVGHITRQELLRYLSGTESHNGFANRLLWTCAQRSKCLPDGGLIPQRGIALLAEEIKRALAWTVSEPRHEFCRDPEAAELWTSIYPSLSEGQPGLYGAATSRAEAQVLRLSAIYAALDHSPVVCVEHLHAALGLWKYCADSARLIFGDATGDPVIDRIRDCLDEAGSDGLTRTEISDLFKRHVSNERIDQALKHLTSTGRVVHHGLPTEGRPVNLWSATDLNSQV